MSLLRYAARRLLFSLLVFLGVTVVAFVLSHVVPADPIIAVLGEHARPEQVAQMRREWGLDRPLPEQYLIYVGKLLRGDWGISIRSRRPVLTDLAEYLPATVELSTAALAVAVGAGIPAGIVSATRKDRWPDHVVRVVSLLGVSMPVFWLGLVLLLVFYYHLGWLPGPGRLDVALLPPPRRTGLLLVDSLLAGDLAAFGDALAHLVLPAVVLGCYAMASVARMTRSALLEVLEQDYVRTARAKGLAERVVIYRHALRNAMIPTLTAIGLVYGSLLSGAVLTETIFSWPGLGRYATNAMVNVDIPAILGVTLVIAVIYTVVNTLVDVLYGVLDPRIRYD